jgi:hypothetical protein
MTLRPAVGLAFLLLHRVDMPAPYENTHRTVELNDAPEHAHLAAEQQKGKQDHLTGSEQSRRALEHGEQTHQNSHATVGHGVAAFSHDDIAALAYQYWEARGGPTGPTPEGSADEDWYRAVKELRTRAVGDRIATQRAGETYGAKHEGSK